MRFVWGKGVRVRKKETFRCHAFGAAELLLHATRLRPQASTQSSVAGWLQPSIFPLSVPGSNETFPGSSDGG